MMSGLTRFFASLAVMLAAQENIGSLTGVNALGPAVLIPSLEGKLPDYKNITNFQGPKDPVTELATNVASAVTGTALLEVGNAPIIVNSAPSLSGDTATLGFTGLTFNHSMDILANAMTVVQVVGPYISPVGQ